MVARNFIKSANRQHCCLHLHHQLKQNRLTKSLNPTPNKFSSLNSLRVFYDIQCRRAEHRRYLREIERAKAEINDLQSKCDVFERNTSTTMQQLDRQKKNFNKYVGLKKLFVFLTLVDARISSRRLNILTTH